MQEKIPAQPAVMASPAEFMTVIGTAVCVIVGAAVFGLYKLFGWF